MPKFTFEGQQYEYAQEPSGRPDTARSWEYGNYPKVRGTLPDAPTPVTVYAKDARWNGGLILVE